MRNFRVPQNRSLELLRVLKHHFRSLGMFIDASRLIFSMFMKIYFSLKNDEKSLIMKLIQDAPGNVCGAKHSPPGHQRTPDCPEGYPPVCIPETPLSPHNFPGTTPIHESKIPVIMIFNALSDGPNLVSRCVRDPLRHRHIFAKSSKIMKNQCS